jgi:hypothetical protein
MRAADLPGRLPQAPSGRRSAALQLLLVDCIAHVNSVPPKESAFAFKTCERTPPPKLPLTTIAEHDPIYPYQTLLVLRSSLATSVPTSPLQFGPKAFEESLDFHSLTMWAKYEGGQKGPCNGSNRVHVQYILPI